MNCTFFQRNLPEYLEGRLTSAQRKRFETHLKQCQSCCSDLELLQQSISLLKQEPKIKASYQLQLQLNQLVEAEPLPNTRKFNFFQGWIAKIIYILTLSIIISILGFNNLFQIIGQYLSPILLLGFLIILICTTLLILLRDEIAELEN